MTSDGGAQRATGGSSQLLCDASTMNADEPTTSTGGTERLLCDGGRELGRRRCAVGLARSNARYDVGAEHLAG